MCTFCLSCFLVLLKIYIRWKCNSSKEWKTHYRTSQIQILLPPQPTPGSQRIFIFRKGCVQVKPQIHFVNAPENSSCSSFEVWERGDVYGNNTVKEMMLQKVSPLLLWLAGFYFAFFFFFFSPLKNKDKLPNCSPRSTDDYRK